MSQYTRQEMSVGAFVVVGLMALGYLSLSLGGVRFLAPEGSALQARFASVGSLKLGDPVKIAGVTVGAVEAISLVKFEAETTLRITEPVKLPADTIASIRSAGLLGDAYVSLSPGAADADLSDGGRILRTEPAISVTDLLAKYAFGSPTDSTSSSPPADDPLAPATDPLAPAPPGAAGEGTSPGTEASAPEPTPSAPKSVFKDPLE